MPSPDMRPEAIARRRYARERGSPIVPRARSPRPARHVLPIYLERRYQRILVGVSRHLRSLILRQLSLHGHEPLLFARTVAHLKGASSKTAVLHRAIDELQRRVLVPLERHNKTQIMRQFSVVLAEPSLAIAPSDALVRNLITASVRENVGLISRLQEDTLDDIERHVLSFAHAGLRNEALSDILEERFGVSESRARLIGRDQLLKANSALTQHRQMACGITHFVWRTSRDEAVRASHRKLDGIVFAWDAPPPIGPPGWDYQCRCTAEPVLEHIGGNGYAMAM